MPYLPHAPTVVTELKKSGNILAINWHDKRDVMLSTIHTIHKGEMKVNGTKRTMEQKLS